jgi:hypothetical protein
MTISRLNLRQSCVSKRGIAEIGGSVVYPSPDGLVAISGADGLLITKNYYTIEEWSILGPSSMVGGIHDGRYHGWTDTHMIIFDLDEELSAITTTDEQVKGLYSDPESDNLYLIQDDKITSWRKGTANKRFKWRSGELAYLNPSRIVAIRILAKAVAYPVTVNIYAENALVQTLSIETDLTRKIPILRKEKFWSIEVEASENIDEIMFTDSVIEITAA